MPLKTSVIDDEVTKLVDVYEAGQVAGRRFEVRNALYYAVQQRLLLWDKASPARLHKGPRLRSN